MMDDEGSYYYLLKGVVIFNQRAVIIINDNFAGKFPISNMQKRAGKI